MVRGPKEELQLGSNTDFLSDAMVSSADRRASLNLRARTSVPRHMLSVGNLFAQSNPQH